MKAFGSPQFFLIGALLIGRELFGEGNLYLLGVVFSVGFKGELPTTHYLLLTTHHSPLKEYVYKLDFLNSFMKVLCYKCNHSWNYKGKNTEGKGYITCSGCYYKIRLDRALVEDSSEQKLLTNLLSLNKKSPKKLSKIPTTHHSLIQLKPLEVKRPTEIKIVEDVQEEIKYVNGFSEFHLRVQEMGYKGNVFKVKEIKKDLNIKVIPRDPLRVLKNRMGYF